MTNRVEIFTIWLGLSYLIFRGELILPGYTYPSDSLMTSGSRLNNLFL